MAEFINTLFSPKEIVIWERVENKKLVNSEHPITSVVTETIQTQKFTKIKGGLTFLESIYYGLRASLTFGNREKATLFGKKSNEALMQVKKGGYMRDGGIKTFISYNLEGITKRVPEEELTLKKES